MPFHRRAQPAEAVSAPAAPPTHFVELRDVCKYYQMGTVRISAADHINFYIEKGEFCVIVGPSGAGKTTVLNMLGGMDTCDEGEIWLDGQLVSRYSPKELTAYRRYDVGFVFQFYNLVQNLTALENVELPLLYRGIGREKRRRMAEESLRLVGLEDRLHHRPAQMSGGQQQRTAIARAVAARPPLILADEPTGNLDTKSGGEVLSILRRLNGEGHTVILITHDMDIAAAARRIVRIQDGKIFEDSRAAS